MLVPISAFLSVVVSEVACGEEPANFVRFGLFLHFFCNFCKFFSRNLSVGLCIILVLDASQI